MVKDRTWRIKDEKRRQPMEADDVEFRRRKKSDKRKLEEKQDAEDIVRLMRERMRY